MKPEKIPAHTRGFYAGAALVSLDSDGGFPAIGVGKEGAPVGSRNGSLGELLAHLLAELHDGALLHRGIRGEIAGDLGKVLPALPCPSLSGVQGGEGVSHPRPPQPHAQRQEAQEDIHAQKEPFFREMEPFHHPFSTIFTCIPASSGLLEVVMTKSP